jgi:hypothetical protein
MKIYSDIVSFDYTEDMYSYQLDLTNKLDKSKIQPADQNLINEIVLWKTNRYVKLDNDTLALLNHSDMQADTFNESFTGKILMKLLSTKGVRLPMASTILRFRNPNIYQIIDQRAYRFSMGEELKLGDNKNNIQVINSHIDLYIKYLDRIRKIADDRGLDFSIIDRVLYFMDKKHNHDKGIKYS